jgi:hypothetical protein
LSRIKPRKAACFLKSDEKNERDSKAESDGSAGGGGFWQGYLGPWQALASLGKAIWLFRIVYFFEKQD